MKLKLKQTIRAAREQHRPPAVIDTEALGISDAEADVLVRRGVAEHYTEDVTLAPADVSDTAPASEPEVVSLADKPAAGESKPAAAAPAPAARKTRSTAG